MGDDYYDYGDWVEDYHACRGEYACEVTGGLCAVRLYDGHRRKRAAAEAGRIRRPRSVCPTCGQVIGLATKEGGR